MTTGGSLLISILITGQLFLNIIFWITISELQNKLKEREYEV